MDNRLNIHFGEDKTKPILIASKHKTKKVPKLNITLQKYTNQTTFNGHIHRFHIR